MIDRPGRLAIALGLTALCAVTAAGADAAMPRGRYLARWSDGSLSAADSLGRWATPDDEPQMAGQRFFGERRELSWLLDTTLPVPKTPEAYVEFIGGDRLPGHVAGYSSGTSAAGREPPHLVVAAEPSCNRPNLARPDAHVLPRWVRRIVWQPVATGFQPGMLFLRDGRQLAFRSLRFAELAVRLLREGGVEEAPWDSIAEIHMPAADAWEAWFDTLAVLSPQADGRIVWLQTSDGLRATASAERFRPDRFPPDDDTAHWFHVVQPAWSLDPLWVPYQKIRLRRYWKPQSLPLSLLEPAASRRGVAFSAGWIWQADANVQGESLICGRRIYGWGLGVHAPAELAFPLHPAVRGLRTELGLDRAAGEGGCARPSIRLDDAAPQQLYSGPTLVGSQPRDTGLLKLAVHDDPAAPPTRLVLAVESPADRPASADPLDIRAVFDWLEPMLSLDGARVRGEVGRRWRGLVPAWDGWTVSQEKPAAGATAGPPGTLLNYWSQERAVRPRFRLALVVPPEPLVLRREVRVTPPVERLAVAVGRPLESSPTRIEIRADGRKLIEFEAPVLWHDHQGPPLYVSLHEFAGRQITLEVIQRGQDQRSLVTWDRLELTDQVPKR